MTLRIVKAEDPIKIDRINLCIYAQPGVGKTTLAFSAAAPLLLDFDKGAYRAANRRDSVPVSSWNDVAGLTAEDLEPYRTVVVDTAGRALDFLSADIIKQNPKAGRGDGSLTLQGFGTLKARFGSWLKMLNTFGKDVLLIAHMDEQRSGDDVIERLDVQGGSKGEIYKSVDAMGRIFVREVGNPAKLERVIDFSPRANSFGKNPASLEVVTIPDPTTNTHFLADLIEKIKQQMNTLSEEQQATQRIIDEWTDAINGYKSEDEINKVLTEIKKAPRAAQLYLAEKAKAMGLEYDKKANLYVGAMANAGR
jgi:hypothetical protein